METTVLTTAVHLERPSGKPLEPLSSQMFTCIHSPNDIGKTDELSLLTTHQRVCFEEVDHLVQEIPSPPYHEYKSVVVGRVPVVLTERSAIKPQPDQVEDLLPTSVLTSDKRLD